MAAGCVSAFVYDARPLTAVLVAAAVGGLWAWAVAWSHGVGSSQRQATCHLGESGPRGAENGEASEPAASRAQAVIAAVLVLPAILFVANAPYLAFVFAAWLVGGAESRATLWIIVATVVGVGALVDSATRLARRR